MFLIHREIILKESIKKNFPESYNLGEDLLFNLQFLTDNKNCKLKHPN